jgi:hypothetical protein
MTCVFDNARQLLKHRAEATLARPLRHRARQLRSDSWPTNTSNDGVNFDREG